MFNRFITTVVLFTGINTLAHANTTHSYAEEYEQAKVFVNEYRELRFSCVSGDYEARKSCFRRLSETHEEYRRAKEILDNADPRYYLGAIAAAGNSQ